MGEADSVEVADLGSGKLQVRGALTFATARQARAAALKALAERGGPAVVVDCGTVTASDSAGLAVLIDWLSLAKRQGRGMHFVNLPAPIRAVARISEVEALLTEGLTG